MLAPSEWNLHFPASVQKTTVMSLSFGHFQCSLFSPATSRHLWWDVGHGHSTYPPQLKGTPPAPREDHVCQTSSWQEKQPQNQHQTLAVPNFGPHFSTSVMFISMDELPPALQDDLQLHGVWQPVLGAPQTPYGDQLRYVRCPLRTCQPLRQPIQFLRCTVELQRRHQELFGARSIQSRRWRARNAALERMQCKPFQYMSRFKMFKWICRFPLSNLVLAVAVEPPSRPWLRILHIRLTHSGDAPGICGHPLLIGDMGAISWRTKNQL